MEELLSNPAIQGGIAPFIVALAIAGVFLKARNLAALAIAGGFITTVILTTGIQFDPMTSTRKIVLIAMVIPIVALILDLFHAEESKKVTPIFYGIGVLSLLWVLWPVIDRTPLTEMILPLLGYTVYVVWMIGVFIKLVEMPRISAAAAATGTGFGIGITALIGASALLGQFGLAFGTAAGAYLLTQVFSRNDEPAGFTFSLSSAFLAALLLPAAVVYAKVPWIVLPLIAIAPLMAFYPFEEDRHIIQNLIGLFVVMAIPIGIAIYFTIQAAGPALVDSGGY